MITAGEFRNGRTFEHEGNVFQIVEFQHVKPGKGAAFVRTKLKNIISGGVVEKTFRPTEKFEEAHIDRKDMAYSYGDDVAAILVGFIARLFKKHIGGIEKILIS